MMKTVILISIAGNNVEIFKFDKTKKASFILAMNERFKQKTDNIKLA